MPSQRVYAVDFRGGNLSPDFDMNGWGDMRVGSSGIAPSVSAEPDGLRLSVTAGGGPAAIGVFAVLPEGSLPLASRLTTKVEFVRPEGVLPSFGSGSPEPWVVALSVRFGDEAVVEIGPSVNVACQFRPNGMRLGTPDHLQGDQPAMLTTPLDYAILSQGSFSMEHHFCGVNAAGRHSVGFGGLTVGPPIGRSDLRVYSSGGLSGGERESVGSLGVMLATTVGAGQIRATLTSFSVSVWQARTFVRRGGDTSYPDVRSPSNAQG